MSNPLYNELQNASPANDFLSRFNQFRSSFKGNPQEQVQALLNSGKITQAQYNQAVRMAKQFQKIIGR